MKAIFWYKGEVVYYTNTTSNVIEPNQLVKIEGRIGIAGSHIDPNTEGTLHVTGVWELPKKASEAIIVGKEVYLADDGITATAGGNTPAGWCVKEAKSTDKTVLVKIG